MHWIAALCIVVLAVTGLYIGKPYFVTGGRHQRPLPDGLGPVHPLRAPPAVLVMTGIVRIYWLFAGNRFERLAALFPVRAAGLGQPGPADRSST